MKKKSIVFISAVLIITSTLFGCSAEKYNVDYLGAQSYFMNAKESYSAGSTVKLEAPVSEKSDFKLYVDGKEIPKSDKSSSSRSVFEFEMPEHNIVVSFESNGASTVAEPKKLLEYCEISESNTCKITLSTYGDYEALLELSSKAGTSDKEKVQKFRVPIDAVNEISAIVNEYEMKNWKNGSDTGKAQEKQFICKIYEDDNVFEASSDNMPSDKSQAFQRMKYVLSQYLTGKYEIKE